MPAIRTNFRSPIGTPFALPIRFRVIAKRHYEEEQCKSYGVFDLANMAGQNRSAQ